MRSPYCLDAEVAAHFESRGVPGPISEVREIVDEVAPETQRSPLAAALTALGCAEHAVECAFAQLAEANAELERLRAELYALQTGTIVVAAERRLPLPPRVPSFACETERPTQRRVG